VTDSSFVPKKATTTALRAEVVSEGATAGRSSCASCPLEASIGELVSIPV